MATMAPAPTSTENITPPRSSHGHSDSWGYNMPHKEDFDTDMNAGTNHDYPQKNHSTTQNGNSNSYHSGMDRVGRKVNSHDNLSSAKLHNSVDGAGARYISESKTSPALNGNSWGQTFGPQTEDEYSRNAVPIDREVVVVDEGSKWIHRDKLARIESEELQAAGIFVPRTRNHSKQRRDRSRSAMRRGTDASENGPRSRKNSTAVEGRNPEIAGESWDLRTPEEIAEEESNAYFTSNSHKGGSRIPVAKTRPGSAHMMKGFDAMSVNSNHNNSLPAPKRTATDTSPKKATTGPRKTSGPSKPGTAATGRPKTRSGSIGNSISTRPSTRSGELSPGNKAPEGDPPWMINSYKPDPRLPPDQQLLPTVARRLQQEKWEKEGKFGDVYDKDFRPLNDNEFGKPDQADQAEKSEETDEKQREASPPEGEWPLKLEPTKSPTQRAGGYSTMPKISDKPQNSPLPSPRTPLSSNAPNAPQAPAQEQSKPEPSTERPAQQHPQQPQPAEDDSKGGCGCCVVM
ncbi:hypothetical protein FVEG_07458 [Fusarium verticillioides 7600]|uniref:TeaA receptor TeaR n=1 Tax=Gibberella moniliformis (strain M3125 / FGSC 7600) TaxID=334819 RepID=W7M6V9_GIBM7|nr:hypothetical protein FVEG_07458 [Fusarium verticillioides 7600]EWG47318.1 hypothetical protein FVEG_07458 [Fusarium verticillioides 7600]